MTTEFVVEAIGLVNSGSPNLSESRHYKPKPKLSLNYMLLKILGDELGQSQSD